MKNRTFYTLAAVLGLWASNIHVLQAEPVRTGTNLNSKAIPSQILTLQKPDEVESIRQLLLDGRKNEALAAAEDYLEKVNRTALPHERLPRYYAWNAYCTVLTSLHQVEEAIAACSTAMAIDSDKWSAVNNRGTAKLIGGMLQDALADYQAAMTLVDEDNRRVLETIEHNIALARKGQ
jgi:tetratricopeptide (TPR) repeat protein